MPATRLALVAYWVLQEERLVRRELGGESIVVLWGPGTASALDTAQIADGRDVGTANAYFERTIDGQPVELQAASDGRHFLDAATESRWNLAGFAVEGPLAGARLAPAPGVQHFWFSHAMLVETADDER